jgi:hypothetical protein
MPYNAVSATKGITALAVIVKLTVTPAQPWTAGQAITLKATVTRDGSPYSGATVRFRWFTGTTPKDIGDAVTDANGVATLSWTIPWTVDTTTVPCTTSTVYAFELASGAYGYVSGKVAYPTRISISAPDSVTAGAYFSISGKLEYESASGVWRGLAGKTVSLYYNDTKIADVSTGSDGSYSKTDVVIPTSRPGTYTLKASYAGEGFTAAIALLGFSVEIPPELTPLAEYATYALAAVPLLTIGGVVAYNEFTKRR